MTLFNPWFMTGFNTYLIHIYHVYILIIYYEVYDIVMSILSPYRYIFMIILINIWISEYKFKYIIS